MLVQGFYGGVLLYSGPMGQGSSNVGLGLACECYLLAVRLWSHSGTPSTKSFHKMLDTAVCAPARSMDSEPWLLPPPSG